jgi:hypothetical protein
VVQRTVNEFYAVKKALHIMKRPCEVVRDEKNDNGSVRSLRSILKDLGFMWKKDTNHKIAVEKCEKQNDTVFKLGHSHEKNSSIVFLKESSIL